MRTLSIVSGLLLVFLFGFALGMRSFDKNWLPARKYVELREAKQSLTAIGLMLPQRAYSERRSGVPDQEFTAYSPERAAAGYTLVLRMQVPGQTYVAELIDVTGNVIHTWPIDYSKLVPGGDARTFTQSVLPLSDGSVLVAFDDTVGLARLDQCGLPIWSRTDRVFHHSITADPVRGFWVWASEISETSHDQRMLRFDGLTGETLEEIRLVEDVIADRADMRRMLTIPEDYEFVLDGSDGTEPDLFHANDVEALSEEMAGAFPEFSAGDLLISLRNLNMVAVVDRPSHRIKWAQYGPWYAQHDPDFQPDGTITVYSNDRDRGRSSILQVHPGSRAAKDRFYATELDFFSGILGKHQRLENGNWLVVSPMEGRVIELDGSGRRVLEIVNIINETHNSVIPYAQHVEPDFFDKVPACPGD